MRNHRGAMLLLIVAAAVRVAVLFHSQTHVHSDEAIIGLMGKHILEGRHFPFYMYGQAYNAGAAWEAYLAAGSFRLFGVGVLALKGVIVAASLACVALFYRMTDSLYDQRTALLAALFLSLSPSLFKWHFQVRGYSWYFLSIPILTASFFAILTRNPVKPSRVLLFGFISGLTLWSLELALSLVGAYWLLLAARRRLSARTAAAGAAGLLAGYAPGVVFNVLHGFSNWRLLVEDKVGGGVPFRPSALAEIFGKEMPKFFGTDTILWYYPDTQSIGYVGYAIAIAAVAVAILPFVRRPSKMQDAWRGDLTAESKDLILVLLTLACFVPYVIAPVRVPGYFLGGCFFLSALTGRLVARGWGAASAPYRILGSAVLAASLVVGCVAVSTTYRRSETETLTLDRTGSLYLARFPAADIEGVERHLRTHGIASVWTTASFVYPLIFESRETLSASGAIFGWTHSVYPRSIARPEPTSEGRQVFVIETNSPLWDRVISHFKARSGASPVVTTFGTLSVIEEPGS